MGILVLFALLAILAIAGVVGTVRLVRRDGYGRRPCESASSAPTPWR